MDNITQLLIQRKKPLLLKVQGSDNPNDFIEPAITAINYLNAGGPAVQFIMPWDRKEEPAPRIKVVTDLLAGIAKDLEFVAGTRCNGRLLQIDISQKE